MITLTVELLGPTQPWNTDLQRSRSDNEMELPQKTLFLDGPSLRTSERLQNLSLARFCGDTVKCRSHLHTYVGWCGHDDPVRASLLMSFFAFCLPDMRFTNVEQAPN